MLSNENKFYISFGISFLIGLFLVRKYVGIQASHVGYATFFIYGFYLIMAAYFYFKLKKPWSVFIAVAISSFMTIILFVPFTTSYAVSLSQPPILDNNWWEALNWIKNNTKECAVIATYWDPGHFIRAIAERPVVFDGATQNAKLYEHIKNRTIVRSRIQDIATVLYTSNETKAVEILKHYKMPNCSEMYFIASSDLIGKSHWWIYFSTWDPKTHTGKKSSYYYARLTGKKPMLSGNGTQYIYNNMFMVIKEGKKMIPYMIYNGNQYSTTPYKIEKIFYFDNYTGYVQYSDNPQIKGMLYLTPDMNIAFFIPEEIENSMFTRMFFFNGAGLNDFKLVKNFGGEVKLFKVEFNETE